MRYAFGNTVLSEHEQLQRARIFCMKRFDALPPPIRAALRECPFDVHFLKPAQYVIVEKIVARIESIKTMDDALSFMADFGTANMGWH